MEKEKIRQLLDKYRRGELTAEEEAFLESWYIQYREPEDPAHEGYEAGELLEDSMLVRERLRESLRAGQLQAGRTEGRKRRQRSYMAAAIALFLLLTGLYYYQRETIPGGKRLTASADSIRPGGNKATLIMANGKSVDLSSEKEGIVMGKKTFVYNDGTAISPALPQDERPAQNTVLFTPKGGQYRVRLSDGTEVWLNAQSSLEYPASFDGLKERRVVLRGEAYFEVAEDHLRPFLVITGKQITKVLGTRFNINSYPEDETAKTTLLGGSLMVTSLTKGLAKTHESRVLRPGQQAMLLGDHIRITEVETDEAVAWKNGYFQFNNKNLETAMTELARWYNVEIEYRNQAIMKQKLAGTISKYASISQVLDKMELTGVMHFSITGKKIIVE